MKLLVLSSRRSRNHNIKQHFSLWGCSYLLPHHQSFTVWPARQLQLASGKEANSWNSWPSVQNILSIYLGTSFLLVTHAPKQITLLHHSFALNNCCLLAFYKKSWSKTNNIWTTSNSWKLELIGDSPVKLACWKCWFIKIYIFFPKSLFQPTSDEILSVRQVLACLASCQPVCWAVGKPSFPDCCMSFYWGSQNWILICPEALPTSVKPKLLRSRTLATCLKMAFRVCSL